MISRIKWASSGILMAIVVGESRWWMRAQTPDDSDSWNFVLAMNQGLDLTQLRPHFPGYPIYVWLGRALVQLGLPGLKAATAISAISAGLTALALGTCTQRLVHESARMTAILTVSALYLVAWQPWLIGSGALSDSLGQALATLAFAMLAIDHPRPKTSACVMGLMLGVRLSYWPIALAGLWLLQHRPMHRSVLPLAAFGAGVLVWLIPFVSQVGVHSLYLLGAEHLYGHFAYWGGTAFTQPNLLVRALDCVRGLSNGLVPSAWILALIIILTLKLKRLTPPSSWTWGGVVLILIPYALWVYLAQNIGEQPRHLLPLVDAGILILGLQLARVAADYPLWPVMCVLWIGCLTFPALFERPLPPANQASTWIQAQGALADTTIFAGRSARALENLLPHAQVRQRVWLSQIIIDLGRLSRLPRHIFLTSEVDLHSGLGQGSPVPARWKIAPGPNFCPHPRWDRGQPCLQLSQLTWNTQP